MAKIPFKVSARTARLIGRENVSNAESAIIELVKNCYDADAKNCILLIDNKYTEVPKKISISEYIALNNETNIIETCYEKVKNEYVLVNDLEQEWYQKLSEIFASKNNIFILDNGEGMTYEVIQNHWMTIGTNNKESNVFSEGGRIRTGAKGIGRFALDRLGAFCEMYTLSKTTKEALKWRVSWNDFESNGLGIEEITADIEEIKEAEIKEQFRLIDINNKFNLSEIDGFINEFKHGTLLKISNLRDFWEDKGVSKIYVNLEMLIPPKEESSYEIILKSSLKPKKYGTVKTSICDDYDYKIKAVVDIEQNINIKVIRNEFDLKKFDMKLFETDDFLKWPYTLKNFEANEYNLEYKLPDLIPGYNPSNRKNILEEIGPFEFTLYFMKKSISKVDRKKFYFKDINTSNRNAWLERFGGIKLYRDNFVVRPYGDSAGSSFDWLNLGGRVTKSPAAATHRSGPWRVRPYQVAGVVNISRLANIKFEDKSNREGLQENSTFEGLKEILIRLIQVFEKDRQYVIRGIDKFNEVKFQEDYNNQLAKKLARDVLRGKFKKDEGEQTSQKTENDKETNDKEEQDKIELLAKSVLSLGKENKELVSEMQVLRSLASTGLVITSFAHELKNLSANILPRTEDLKEILYELIEQEKLTGIEEYNNPFIMINDFREQDTRLKNWLDLSLSAIRKDKRTMKKLELFTLFNEFKRTWSSALEFQSVNLRIPDVTPEKKCLVRFFQIDFDSIFNNLISNSLDAFQRNDASSNREIKIELFEEDKKLLMLYTDSGPGLSDKIKDPYEIFDSLFTTKVDSSGKPVGTGLGMWILKSSIDYYKGDVIIDNAKSGFALKIVIPLKKDEGIFE
ncbi:hypothetical protein ASG66_17080 [Bacillus sp. Leaf406]|nr:hypothetical protein ASG66_17080 [Bacillus sp. Leaf406]